MFVIMAKFILSGSESEEQLEKVRRLIGGNEDVVFEVLSFRDDKQEVTGHFYDEVTGEKII